MYIFIHIIEILRECFTWSMIFKICYLTMIFFILLYVRNLYQNTFSTTVLLRRLSITEDPHPWHQKITVCQSSSYIEIISRLPLKYLIHLLGLRKEIEQCSPSQLCRKVSLTLNLKVVNLNPCNKSHLTPNLFKKIPEMYFLMFLPELFIQRLYDFKMKAPQKLHMRFFHWNNKVLNELTEICSVKWAQTTLKLKAREKYVPTQF